jgi:ribonucleoside-diphosphate reductase alpha chain
MRSSRSGLVGWAARGRRCVGRARYIGGTNGESQGVIPFLKLHNDQLVAVNQCFGPETVVYTADGPKAIRDIEKGDLVLGNSGTYREVTEKFAYDQKGPMVAVKIKHSVAPIRVTSGHPFFAIRGVPMEQTCERTMRLAGQGQGQERVDRRGRASARATTWPRRFPRR